MVVLVVDECQFYAQYFLAHFLSRLRVSRLSVLHARAVNAARLRARRHNDDDDERLMSANENANAECGYSLHLAAVVAAAAVAAAAATAVAIVQRARVYTLR